MTHPRITLVTSGLAAGGSELQLTQLACGLQQDGWRPRVLSLQSGGVYRDTLQQAGVPVAELPLGRLAGPVALARLARGIRATRPALVHTQAFRANLWGRLAASLQSVPVVASVRATYSYLPRAYRPVERLLALASAYVVTPSDASSRYLVEQIGVPAAKVVTIPNGVDTALFSPATDGAPFRAAHAQAGDFVILTAGRLVAQKNHAALLRAFALLYEQAPNARLLIAGSGPLEAELRSQAAPLGERVCFLGELPRATLAGAIAAADTVCLLSNFEGTPNAVLEAMAGGKPVVATAVDGVPEVIDDGVEGLLVPRGDVEGAAAALLRLARSPELRAALGRNGRRRVEAQHSIAVNVERYERLYRRVIARRSRTLRTQSARPDVLTGGLP
ncbi:MAG TPA: glycosyltransferase [Dehalococcoidia bacterium]|jgi:glycosyltransferase involved in cell wall biosynthesis|nr:glycosyltransferase [Dehalococcoidia bacterium]